MTKGYFITGTDTNVGKTTVCAWLVRHLSGHYWKPVQSGIEAELRDQETIVNLAEVDKSRIYPSAYEFQASLSPHQAAQLEKHTVDLTSIQIPKFKNMLIVEGAGGLLVPLNEKDLLIDLIEIVGLSVIIIARSTIGTVNHTLLTIAALRARSLDIAGVIVNGQSNPQNCQDIESFGKIKILEHLPLFTPLTAQALFQYKPTSLKA